MKNLMVVLVFVVIFFAIVWCVECRYKSGPIYKSDGSFIAWDLCRFDSPDSLNENFAKIINQRAESDGFRVFQITNGSSWYSFVQAYNGPRGVPMFSLYCYQHAAGRIYLRGYVPINNFWFKDVADNFLQNVDVYNEGEYTKASYRGMIVFSVSTNWEYKGALVNYHGAP